MTVRILLVEDSEDDIELTLRAMEKNNLRAETLVVRDGQEALDFLFCQGAHAGRDPDALPEVVLLDLKLPRLDGPETLRRIREDGRTRLLPVVILTSSAEQRDMIQTYALGANSYVQKPVNYNDFIEAMRQLGRYWLALNRRPTPGPR